MHRSACHDLAQVRPLTGHTLRLWFDDGSMGDLDLTEYLKFEGVFAPLRDVSAAQGARIDPATGALSWPNGIDLDPEAIHRHLTALGALRHSDETLLPPSAPAPGTDRSVPELSRFFGILVAMYLHDHEPPHFRVRYGGYRGRFAIAGQSWIDGDLPPRARGLVEEWAALHRDELQADWERARRSEPLLLIAPLE